MKYKVEKPFTDLFCNVRLRYYLIVKNTDLFCKIREHLVISEEACKQCKNIIFKKSRVAHPCQSNIF